MSFPLLLGILLIYFIIRAIINPHSKSQYDENYENSGYVIFRKKKSKIIGTLPLDNKEDISK